MQSQNSLNDQLTELHLLVKDSGLSSLALTCVTNPHPSLVHDERTRNDLFQCVMIANSHGLYDAADCLKYNVLELY